MTLKLTNLKARYTIEIDTYNEKEKLRELYNEDTILTIFIDNKAYVVSKTININHLIKFLNDLESHSEENFEIILSFILEYFELENSIYFDIQDVFFHPEQTRQDTFDILVDYGCIEDQDIEYSEKWMINKIFTTGYMGNRYFEWKDGVIEWLDYNGTN